MSELKVPTVALRAEIACADGRMFAGRIFVPAGSHHGGAMRPGEWLNEPPLFFPFLPDETDLPVLVNKDQVLVVSVPTLADEVPEYEDAGSVERRVILECGDKKIEGIVVIQLPENQRRVLDYVNQAIRFVSLRDGERHHYVQKHHVTRVIEVRED